MGQLSEKTLGMVGMFTSGARQGALTYLADIHHVSSRPREHFAVEKNKQLYQFWVFVNLKKNPCQVISVFGLFSMLILCSLGLFFPIPPACNLKVSLNIINFQQCQSFHSCKPVLADLIAFHSKACKCGAEGSSSPSSHVKENFCVQNLNDTQNVTLF